MLWLLLTFFFLFICKAKSDVEDYGNELQKAIQSATDYLTDITLPDGKFKYYTIGDKELEKDPLTYNTLRHVAMVYELTEVYQFYKENEWNTASLKDVILRSARWIEPLVTQATLSSNDNDNDNGNYHYEGDDDKPMKGLLYRSGDLGDIVDELTSPRYPDGYFDLGGTSFVLLAFSSIKKLGLSDDYSTEELEQVGNLIVYFLDHQSTTPGKFRSYKFIQGVGLDPRDNKGTWVQGQAALALLNLYDIDGRKSWLIAAKEIMEYQASQPDPTGDVLVHDHWFLIAAEKLFNYQNLVTIDKDLIISKVISIAVKIIQNQDEVLEENGDDSVISGALDSFGFCCHSSHETQGMVSAALLFRNDGLDNTKTFKAIRRSVYLSTQFMFRCQTASGGMADSVYQALSDVDYESFLDAPGHALGAWMGATKLFH